MQTIKSKAELKLRSMPFFDQILWRHKKFGVQSGVFEDEQINQIYSLDLMYFILFVLVFVSAYEGFQSLNL